RDDRAIGVRFVHALLLDVGQQVIEGRANDLVGIGIARNEAVRIVGLVGGQQDLVQVVGALAAAGGGARFLHGREGQADQRADDGNYDQQLDQREGPAV